MSDDLTPHAALAAAGSARSAASAHVVPRWFPLAAASAFAVGLTLAGASLLASGGARQVLGLAGAAALTGFAALWVVLVAWWRRRGVVPVPVHLDRRLSRRQRSAMLAADVAAIALALAVLAVTSRPGWAAIVWAWAGGAALYYRLRVRAA